MGSADPPPDPREVVLDAVEAGKMTPAEAERWAQDRNATPFQADLDYDPMREPSWDLGMIIAWIMTRDPVAVRRVAGALGLDLREWAPILRRHLSPATPQLEAIVVRHRSHGTDKLSIEVLLDIAMEYARGASCRPCSVSISAFDELTKRRAGGRRVQPDRMPARLQGSPTYRACRMAGSGHRRSRDRPRAGVRHRGWRTRLCGGHGLTCRCAVDLWSRSRLRPSMRHRTLRRHCAVAVLADRHPCI